MSADGMIDPETLEPTLEPEQPRSLVYRTTRDWSAAHGGEMGPGGFARVLKHEPSYRPIREYVPERSSSKAAFTKTPRDRKTSTAKPRWTEERIAALPKTSGSLTRTGIAIHEGCNAGAMHVVLACSGGSDGCRKRMEVPAQSWARDSSRPKSCKACSLAKRKSTYNPAFCDKGYAQARAFAAAEKRRQDEPEAAE